MARLNFFERARQGVERTVDRAVQAVQSAAQSAINEVRSLGEAIASPFRRSDNTENEIFQRRDEEIRNLRKQESDWLEELARQSEDYKAFQRQVGTEGISMTEYLLLKWGADELDRQALKASKMGIYENVDAANLTKGERVRRKPHPTLASAAEYSRDVPRGYTIGITRIGGFFYVMVDDNGKDARRRNSKKRKSRKRRNRRVP